MTLQPVVAAAIVDNLARLTRLLAAARSYPGHLKGYYELPGGKVEPGENPAAALDREIWEELGCCIALGPLVSPPARVQDSHDPSKSERAHHQEGNPTPLGPSGEPWPILNGRVMWVWLAEVKLDSPQPAKTGSHLHLLWVPLDDAANLPWLPSNQPIVNAVVEEAVAGQSEEG